MALFVLERSFETPCDIAAWRKLESESPFRELGVTEVLTFLSTDGKRMLTLYEASEVQDVEQANADAKLPYTKVWAAGKFRELMGMPSFKDERGRDTVVCERDYGQAVPLEAVAKMSAAANECLELANCDLIESYIPTTNDGSVCIFAAPDAESVRRANRTAHLPFTSVWTATVHSPGAQS